ncbi:hypothetical protein [Zavarzinella formosa]|uniref:hypothetical protein n=1 Tax=Zavarzinella formosa TaxID=360055 RepID=UPI000315492A|nr:hypothetical protein [Zavarzinella formosa]
MSAPKKLRVTVRLTQRSIEDCPELLEQVRKALRQKGITLVVLSAATEDNCRVPNEQLETEAMKLAAAVLDREARKAREVAVTPPEADAEAKPEPKPEDKQADAETRIKRLRKWMGKLAATGWKVVVDAFFDKVLPPGRGA